MGAPGKELAFAQNSRNNATGAMMKNATDAAARTTGFPGHTPPGHRGQLNLSGVAQRTPAAWNLSAPPPVFCPAPVKLASPPVYRPQAGSIRPIQRAAVGQASAAPAPFRPALLKLTPPPVYLPAQGGKVQMRGKLPEFAHTIAVKNEGRERYNRLLELLQEAPVILKEIKDVRVYETIFSRTNIWYQSLREQWKKSEQWVKDNPSKNVHEAIAVPNEMYLTLAEMCVGYRRELNDSYRDNRKTILQEDAALSQKYKQEEEDEPTEEEEVNPKSVPKELFRWVSTDEAKRAKKEGIAYDPVGGGIPTSTKGTKGIALDSGAVAVSKRLIITTALIPDFKFEYVSTRTKLKEVKVKCDIPPGAIQ